MPQVTGEIDNRPKWTEKDIERQLNVEKAMLAGYTITQIYAMRLGKKPLGTREKIKDDFNLIRSRWLQMDPDWFHRTRLARITAENRLKEQLIRYNKLLLDLDEGKYDKVIITHETTETPNGDGTITKTSKPVPITTKSERARAITYAESQLSSVITKLYDIESDFDPEQYLDERIKERLNEKVKTLKATHTRAR